MYGNKPHRGYSNTRTHFTVEECEAGMQHLPQRNIDKFQQNDSSKKQLMVAYVLPGLYN